MGSSFLKAQLFSQLFQRGLICESLFERLVCIRVQRGLIGREFSRHLLLAGVPLFRESNAAFRTELSAVKHAINLI